MLRAIRSIPCRRRCWTFLKMGQRRKCIALARKSRGVCCGQPGAWRDTLRGRTKAGGARHEGTTTQLAAPASVDKTEPSMAAAPAATAPVQEYAAAAPPMSPTPAKMLQKAVKSPEEWLDEIARLRASGDEAGAEREYAEFRKAYPDYVPEDLNAPNR